MTETCAEYFSDAIAVPDKSPEEIIRTVTELRDEYRKLATRDERTRFSFSLTTCAATLRIRRVKMAPRRMPDKTFKIFPQNLPSGEGGNCCAKSFKGATKKELALIPEYGAKLAPVRAVIRRNRKIRSALSRERTTLKKAVSRETEEFAETAI